MHWTSEFVDWNQIKGWKKEHKGLPCEQDNLIYFDVAYVCDWYWFSIRKLDTSVSGGCYGVEKRYWMHHMHQYDLSPKYHSKK